MIQAGAASRVAYARRMKVGDQVRVLAIPDWLIHDLPQEDVDKLRAQVGTVHEIREVQPGGYLWLSGWFALMPNDVELVEAGAAARFTQA